MRSRFVGWIGIGCRRSEILLPAVVIVGWVSTAAAAGGLPAFPGAEGFGTTTPGGRGGRVYTVTSLADRGPGTLREACEAKGPRIVVFAVGGYITLESDIELTSPYCTIAGQTAPGGGICVRGRGLTIRTHDMVVRHLRFRMGRPAEIKDVGFRAAFRIHGGPQHHVIIDHCSISRGFSRNIITWGGVHDVTVSWTIVSEALRDPGDSDGTMNGMGFLIGDNTKDISVHHCLFAHNYQRNPRLKHGVHADLVNNVVYNWEDSAASLCGDFERKKDAPAVEANIVGCYYKAGYNSRIDSPVVRGLTSTSLFWKDNLSNMPWFLPEQDRSVLTLTDKRFPAPPVTVVPAERAMETVLANVGATRPMRDAADERVVRSVREGVGRFIRHQDEVGGWPELAAGEPRRDTDGDGMPDEWEKAHGLDPADPRDGSLDRDGDGYTNIEEWMNGLVAEPATAASP